MKAKSTGKNKSGLPVGDRGFSTLELMISLAVITVVLTGALSANFAAEYWSITSQTSNEALYKAKTKLEDIRALAKQDFFQATSSPFTKSADITDPNDAACIAGGLCYFVRTDITDFSSCSKYAEAQVAWQVSGYSTTTTSLFTNITNTAEAIALGGDCLLNQPTGHFESMSPQTVGVLNFNPGKIFTGIDVLHRKIYVTASTSPYFIIFDSPTAVGTNPILVGSTNGAGLRLNAVDVVEDISTGRMYAFVAQHSTTTQLAVIDVTDAYNPSLIAQRRLQGANPPSGLYSEGWKIFVYKNRLYITTRETTGYELHIFDIGIPTQPTEISSAQLNRTVTDMVVRDQMVGGSIHRFLYLSADSNAKELGVFDVTSDVITEVNSVDLPGISDGQSLSLLGNKLYFGRQSTVAGPDLYVFDVTNPSVSLSTIGQQGEVGADVISLRATGAFVFVGTSKTGQEFQVWNSDSSAWNPSVLNYGRFSSYSFSNLAPLGIDIDGDWVYVVSQSNIFDTLQVFYATP